MLSTYAAIVYIQGPFEFKSLKELSSACEKRENYCYFNLFNQEMPH